MRDIITQGDLTYIREQYPEETIPMPSVRQQQMLSMHLRGMVPLAIARALGDADSRGVTRFLKTNACQAILDFLRANEFTDIRASREYLTSLFFECYHKAGTSLEEIAALREIGKLNGLYLSDEKKASKKVTINQTGNIQNVKHMESMTTQQLLDIAKAIPTEQPKLPEPAYIEVTQETPDDGI